MSSHITRRLLLSTCLPVMILSLSASQKPAFAGFEWTPPEATEEVIMPDVPAPVVKGDALPSDEAAAPTIPTMEPVYEQPVMENTPENSGASSMKTRVFKPKDAAPPAEPPVEPAPAEMAAPAPTPAPVEPTPAPQDDSFLPMPHQAQTQEAPIYVEPEQLKAPPASQMHAQQAEIVPEVQHKIEQPAQEQMPAANPKENGELTINPFPLKEKSAVQENSSETVVLPTDTKKKLSSIEASDSQDSGEKIIWNENETYEVVEGFGKDMPLVMALGQIVPAKYAYFFGRGVNPGASVSWDGGKPWNEVLQHALAPLHIGIQVEDKKISLFMLNAPQTAPEEMQAPQEEAEIQEPAQAEPMQINEPSPAPQEQAAVIPMPEEAPKEEVVVVEEPAARVAPAPEEKAAETVVVVTPESPIAQDEKSKTQALQAQQLEKLSAPKTAPQDSPASNEVEQKKKNLEQAHPQAAEVLGMPTPILTADEPAPEAIQEEEIIVAEVAEPEPKAVVTADAPAQVLVPTPEDKTIVVEEIAVEQLPAKDVPAETILAADPKPIAEEAKVEESAAIAPASENPEKITWIEPKAQEPKPSVDAAAPAAADTPIAAPDQTSKTAADLNSAELAKITPTAAAKTSVEEPKAAEIAVVEDVVVAPVPQPQAAIEEPAPLTQITPPLEVIEVPKTEAVAVSEPQEDKQQDIEAAHKALSATRIWEGKKGDSLQKILQKWCKETKTQLVWNTSETYKLSQNVIISGTLDTALNVTFDQAIKNAPAYKLNKDGMPTLTIE